MTTMPTTEETKALSVIERAALALNSAESRTALRELVAKSSALVEIKNTAARDQVHGAAMTLRTRRTDIRKTGKDARDDATKFSKAVIAEEDELVAIIEPEEQRLLALRDAWDERVAAEKRAKVEAEARRVATIREHIDGIRAWVPTAAGQSSDAIETVIKTLVALQIDTEHFAEMTGDAELARGETLDRLRALRNAAEEREAEARRVAEESARLARERAEFEAEQARAAAERAEQERRDAEARAARDAEERAQREREEAARREQQAREDAERRAALEEQERRARAEREEIARRQAELDRAEREAQEREEARQRAEREELERINREAREHEENIAREARQRASAENRAARLAPEPTGGEWFAQGTEVRTTVKLPGVVGTGHNDEEYYGTGALIAESVMRPADGHLLAAAPALLAALVAITDHLERVGDTRPHKDGEFIDAARAAIAKAAYQPEPVAA